MNNRAVILLRGGIDSAIALVISTDKYINEKDKS